MKKQRLAIEQKNKQRLLELNPDLDNGSGIYFLTREEGGFKYAYIGQAVHILKRLQSHLVGYQHIDLSLKSHGLYDDEKNPCGWKVGFLHYPAEELDKWERHWIKAYANNGYQLRNHSIGGQGEGKSGMDNQKPARGYYDGIAQGRKNLARELKGIIDKHLLVMLKPDKATNKTSQKMLDKFWDLLNME